MLPFVCSVIDHRWRQNVSGKKKKVAHEAIGECVTDVLTTFWRLLWSFTELLLLFVLYNKELHFIRIKADGNVNRVSVL